MQKWRRVWGLGVYYGFGLMNIRLVPFMRKYYGWGHLGSISSFSLYFPKLDIYVIGNFNQSKRIPKSTVYIRGTCDLSKLQQ